MRRKSERSAATKKTKASPEKKLEKVKRTRSSRRKKNSTSSENESADEGSPPREAEPVVVTEEVPPKTPIKEDSPEEQQDQVWRVTAAQGSGDTGEIQKLKICLTRPPSTPERADRSPRSKRKQSRATSSSDTPSVEGPDERRKSKHRSKRSHRESKDESEKTQDSQDDEAESDTKCSQGEEKPTTAATQSEGESKVDSSENTISTSQEEPKSDEKSNVDSTEDSSKTGEGKSDNLENEKKASDADTTVVSPEAETTVVSATPEPKTPTKSETQETCPDERSTEPESPTRRRSASVDKSEILELHPEDSKVDSDLEAEKSKGNIKISLDKSKEDKQVSKLQDESPNKEPNSDNNKFTNKTGVVESTKSEKRLRNMSTDSGNDGESKSENARNEDVQRKSFDRSDSILSNHDENHHNGQAAPIVVSRKRRWGSRPAKITKQKSITISTDVLKDIIPDVKPVEFEEVIEEKKHKRVVTEKIERPVLPKIVIDNSENVLRAEQEHNKDKKEHNDKDIKDIVKVRDMASNRKISIIKDNDSIITRPPSPPRHKQSCILYITNLVRPFTLPQLKNLLQRTGRLVENGFWIDRIKSKCYVIYESEDQAVETRHALHGVTWPVSNPKALQVDFSTQEAFDKAKMNEDSDNAQVSTIPGTVEDWLREQDMKRERGELDKPWERKTAMREWDLGKNDKDNKDKERIRREERPPIDKRRHRTPERSPEPARKFKKKEEEAPAKLLDDLFKKTKTTPCIYWLPLSAETIAIKEEQRRQHMAEHERRMLEQRRTHRRH